MDALDLPTHQLILDSLALNLAQDIANIPSARSHVRSLFANSATTSKVTTNSNLSSPPQPPDPDQPRALCVFHLVGLALHPTHHRHQER